MPIKLSPLFLLLFSQLIFAQSRWEIPRRDRDVLIDGFLREWSGVPALSLSPGAAGLRSGGTFESGDVDLKIQALWDDQYLYFALTWIDNVWDVEEVTRRDAVWIDPEKKRRDRMFFFDYLKFHIRTSDYDYTLWLSPRVEERGPFFWYRLLEGYRGMERATSSPMVTSREAEGGVTTEVMFLWKELKLKPDRKEALPVTMILSDSDNPGRLLEYKLDYLKWLAWRGGVFLVE